MELKLKVLWHKDFLGFAINQEGVESFNFLTSYYFWPKTEVWEQLNLELNTKPWFLEKDKIKILNLIAEIMNYWKQNRNIQSLTLLKNNFTGVEFSVLQGIGL